ncbi:MAG: M23 family metallopeptidase [Caulobacterales bacterium]|jgi:murein DD-endopeptidase MepM/ murein hydrolase activator NlpD|nr:M23 family metallopeptidase [Caulobacterales bacterium]
MRALLLALALAACAGAEAPAQPEAPVAEPPVEIVGPVEPPPPATLTLACAGAFTQGGVALCRTLPGAAISVDGVASGVADAQGWAVIGFNREHGAEGVVSASASGATAQASYAIAQREFDIQRVNGLPQQTVTPTDPAVLERIQREAALKRDAFASLAPLEGFLDGFIMPIEGGTVTGRWGNQRVLNGTPSTPHFGYDIAAPAGTAIRAPAAGVVTLANPDMHYEGGLVFIDHGQGLITMYLHMSRLDVAVGDRVEQGRVIGAVGASGRATGPHLCWRMRWRERQLDPSVAVEGLAAARAELLAR